MLSTVLGDVTQLSITSAAWSGDSPSRTNCRLDDLVSFPMLSNTTVAITARMPGVVARSRTWPEIAVTKEHTWRR